MVGGHAKNRICFDVHPVELLSRFQLIIDDAILSLAVVSSNWRDHVTSFRRYAFKGTTTIAENKCIFVPKTTNQAQVNGFRG